MSPGSGKGVLGAARCQFRWSHGQRGTNRGAFPGRLPVWEWRTCGRLGRGQDRFGTNVNQAWNFQLLLEKCETAAVRLIGAHLGQQLREGVSLLPRFACLVHAMLAPE